MVSVLNCPYKGVKYAISVLNCPYKGVKYA